LFALDLADPQAVRDFVNRFGPLGVFTSWERLTGGLKSYLEEDVWERVVRSRRRLQEAPGAKEWLAARIDPEFGEDPFWNESESLEEFRFGARVLRDLTRAWMYLSEPGSPSQPEWELPLAHWVDDWIGRAGTAASGLVTTRTASGSAANSGRTPPPLFPSLALVCALELYNHFRAP
jgi:hypothetical protein